MKAARFITLPSGTVPIEVKLWQWNGVRLMTHQTVGFDGRGIYRVSEETTGYGIPDTFSDTSEDAEKLALLVLEKHREKLAEVIGRFPVINT